MDVQRAIRILANTKIMLYQNQPQSSKNVNSLDNLMVCASNFEPPAINEAFQTIITWYINIEEDIMGDETPNLPSSPTQKEMLQLAIATIKANKIGKYKLVYERTRKTIIAVLNPEWKE